jgi:FMN phosphatase YigB (HAD superfamily)
MLGGPIFFDLDDTLLDDTGAQNGYLAELFVAWRGALPHDEAAAFGHAWRTALARHWERHLRGDLTNLEQRRERIRDVFQAASWIVSA